ncbi:MAG: hypothetical protein ACT4RN_14785 [Pseudonocardia sp.]
MADETGAVFTGPLPGIDRGLVGIHISDADDSGARLVRAYVCDGQPTDAGGLALWFTGELADGETTLTSPGGEATLTFAAGETVTGTATLGDGRSVEFAAPPATNGSGIYDVTVGADDSYVGRSTLGDVLDGTLSGDPQILRGTVTLVASDTVTLAGQPANNPILPGTFVAVAAYDERTGVLAMSGRSGDVRRGSPGLNIIGFQPTE